VLARFVKTSGPQRIESAQHVVVDRDAADAAIAGKHSCVRLDQLRSEDAMYGPEQCVAAHQIQIPAELFNAI
jgi:hypothetical protein